MHIPKLFLIIDLLSFAKLLELLAINYGLSEKRITFVKVLPRSGCFITCIGAHFPTVELDNATFPECQGSCSIVPNGHTSLVVSFNIHQGLKCKDVASTPTLTMWLLCSNCALPWTTKFLGVFSKANTM